MVFKKGLDRDIAKEFRVVGYTKSTEILYCKKINLCLRLRRCNLPPVGISIPEQEYTDVNDKGKKEVMGEIQVLPVAEKDPYQQGAPDDVEQEDERQSYTEEGPPAGRT
jgi:hypothetical protein